MATDNNAPHWTPAYPTLFVPDPETWVETLVALDRAWRVMVDSLRPWLADVAQTLGRLWNHLVAWIQRQGILSPAYAYASPAMRRRAARQRARLATQAKHRHR